jgi:predicted CopG family antitoxin
MVAKTVYGVEAIGKVPTKTITLDLDVYDRLKDLKLRPAETFSEVLRRVLPSRARTVREIATAYDAGHIPSGLLTDADLAFIEEIDQPLNKADFWVE